MVCIFFPDAAPISQVNAFVLSIASFPLFAFYASRYDEKEIIPINYLPNAYSHARGSLESDGGVLFIGRLFVLGFMALLIYAAILLGPLNAGDMANDIAIYAYYSLVMGVALIALSSWGRREISMDGKKVERSSLDLGLSSSYRFLKARLNAINGRRSYIVPIKSSMNELEMRQLLNSVERLQSRLDAMQQTYDRQLEEIRKRLRQIEEKLDLQTE